MNVVENYALQMRINSAASKMAADTVEDYMHKIVAAVELALREQFGFGDMRIYRFTHAVNERMPEPYKFEGLPAIDYIPAEKQLNLAEILLSFGCNAGCKCKDYKICDKYKGYKYMNIQEFSSEDTDDCPYKVVPGKHGFKQWEIDVLREITRRKKVIQK